MRVLDIITEGPVHPLQTVFSGIGVTNPIGFNNHQPNQVVALKQALKNHRLVTGRNGTNRTLGGMAWQGDESEEWTQDLTNALANWKRSINFQVSPNDPRRPLDVAGTPTLRAIDVRYLLAELNSDGTLKASADGGPSEQNIMTRGPMEGITIVREIPGTIEDATNTAKMVEAVGHSAWFRIAAEIAESKFSTRNQSWLKSTPENEAGRTIHQIYSQFFMGVGMPFADEEWLRKVNRAAGNTRAVFLDGSEQPIAYTIKIAPTAQELFTYYSDMAKKLWEKDNAEDAANRSANDAVSNNPVSAETLDLVGITALAQEIYEAMDNSITRKVNPFTTGGFFNDVDRIRNAIGKLRTAADYDNLASAYEKIDRTKLNEDLVKELSKEDYTNIIVSRLIGIRRIAPTILHASINFGSETEIEVTGNDGKTYTVSKTKDPTDDHFISNYAGYDAILIDEIYKKAIDISGGTLPNFDEPPDAAALDAIKPMFIDAINRTYPEMVAFYVRAEPFDEASVDLGGARLRGILDDAARLGGDPDTIKLFITDEIGKDREFLIVGKDGSGPAMNIYFDPKYRDEGLADRDFTVLNADEEVELNVTETQIKSALMSTDPAVVEEAVTELLQDQKGRETYMRIYRESAATKDYLDEMATFGDGEDDILKLLNGSTTNNTPISNIAREFGVAVAAPMVCAKLFRKAITKGLIAGTDEKTIEQLLGQMQAIGDSRENYELIDERYRQLPGVNDSLIDDIAGEQFVSLFGFGWYATLAKMIGEESRVDAIRVELPADVIDAVEAVESSPSEETINKLKQKIGSDIKSNEDQLELIIDRLTNVFDDMSDQSSAEAIIISELLKDLQEAYDNL